MCRAHGRGLPPHSDSALEAGSAARALAPLNLQRSGLQSSCCRGYTEAAAVAAALGGRGPRGAPRCRSGGSDFGAPAPCCAHAPSDACDKPCPDASTTFKLNY
eukprot:6191002-Pleurochrysis_carterae.AAC.1